MGKDMMNYMVGKVVKINRGGSESRIGLLLDVYNDYIALLTEDDGVVYYNTYHIKSITDNVKESLNFNLEVPKDLEFKKASDFQALLDSLKFQWIRINRGGPEKLEGVLSDVNKDCVSLISKEEIVRVAMFHIKNISYGAKSEKAEESKNQNLGQSDKYQNNEKQSRQSVVKSSDNNKKRRNRNKRNQEEFSTVEGNQSSQEFDNPVPSSERKANEPENISQLINTVEKLIRNLSNTN